MTPKTGCTGKKRFVRFDEATTVAKRIRRKKEDAYVEAYHCKHCQGIHIGESRDHGKKDKRKEQFACSMEVSGG